MLVDILTESREVVDSFKVCFFDEIMGEAKNRIQSGSIRAGHFFRAGDTFWRVVEADGTLAIEIDKELTEEAKRLTEDRARERGWENNSADGSHSGVEASPVWILGIPLLLTWTIGWIAFSSQLHTGWLAEEFQSDDGPIANHEFISVGMILLGWLFGLGAIASYSPRAQQKESQ